jgi:hypothetical protein
MKQAQFAARLRETRSGCREWTGATDRGGYGNVKFFGRATGTHRVAWILENGDIPHGLWVLHRCDNPLCCNPDHLFLGTRRDNIEDMIAKGRKAVLPGSKHPNAKLYEESVRRIREASLFGAKRKDLARLYGVIPANISMIVTRQSWRHVQ